MKVNLKWMLAHMKLCRAHFYILIRAGKIPKPFKLSRLHAEWDKEEILRLFPNGWNHIPQGSVDINWMCEYFNLGRSRIYELMKQGKIPYQRKVHTKKGYWVESEIREKFKNRKWNED